MIEVSSQTMTSMWQSALRCSQGSSLDEAIANLKEATEFFLEEFPLLSRPRL